MRTQKQPGSTTHLANSLATFLRLVEKVRTVDQDLEQGLIDARDYETLDAYTLQHLLGVPTGETLEPQQFALANNGNR